MYFHAAGQPLDALRRELLALRDGAIGVKPLLVVGAGVAAPALDGVDIVGDVDDLLARRFDARPGSYYLLRPDQHVCARWRAFEPARVQEALLRATGHAAATHTTTGSTACLEH